MALERGRQALIYLSAVAVWAVEAPSLDLVFFLLEELEGERLALVPLCLTEAVRVADQPSLSSYLFLVEVAAMGTSQSALSPIQAEELAGELSDLASLLAARAVRVRVLPVLASSSAIQEVRAEALASLARLLRLAARSVQEWGHLSSSPCPEARLLQVTVDLAPCLLAAGRLAMEGPDLA